MNKLALPLLIGLVAVAMLAWFLLGDPTTPGTGVPLPGERGGDDPTRQLTGGGELRRQPTGEGGERQIDPGRRTVDQRRVVVRGRCLAAESEIPIAGCEVRITARPPRGGLAAAPAASAEASARTAADGRFEVEIAYPSRHRLQLVTRAPRYADMVGNLGSDKSIAVGDILIPPGTLLQGRVLTTDRAPLPATNIRLSRIQLSSGAAGKPTAIRPLSWISLESDAGGRVQSEARLACQTWSVRAADHGLKLIEPTSLEVTAGQAVQHVDFVVELPDPKTMIQGRLVDADDRPIGNTVVQARDDGKWPIGYGFADQDGKFAVRCRKQPGAPVRLAVPQAAGFEPLVTQATFAWGSEDVTLVLERTSELQIVVYEAGTETPVERYAVIWYQASEPGRGSRQRHRGRPEHHPEGRAVVTGVPSGPTRILVAPVDPALAPNDPIEFVKQVGQPALRIELQRRNDLPVRVTTQSGAAVAGTRLELVRPDGAAPVTLNTRVVDHGNFAQLGFLRGDRAIRLDQADTDQQGRATLRWVATPTPLAIRVLGPNHIPTVHHGVIVRQDSPRVDIVVQTGATLAGQLEPLDVLDQLRTQSGNRRWRGLGPRVQLTFIGAGGPTGNQRIKNATIDERGRFELKGLAPGTWEVRFTSTRFGLGRGATVGSKVLGTVDLGAGAVQRVRYDISDLKPARLRGRVLLNGSPAAQRAAQLTQLAQPDRPGRRIARSLVVTTDDTGSFDASLAPGRYAVSLEVRVKGQRNARLTSATLVDIPPGGDVSRDFTVESGRLRVRLTDAEGQPVARRLLQINAPANGYVVGRATEVDGWMRIDAIAAGTYRIRVSQRALDRKPGGAETRGPGAQLKPGPVRRGAAGGQFIDIGEVTVRPGDTPTTIEVKLPAK